MWTYSIDEGFRTLPASFSVSCFLHKELTWRPRVVTTRPYLYTVGSNGVFVRRHPASCFELLSSAQMVGGKRTTLLQLNMQMERALYKTTILYRGPSMSFYVNLGQGKLGGTCTECSAWAIKYLEAVLPLTTVTIIFVGSYYKAI